MNFTLKYLNISGNRLGDTGGALIAKALSKNPQIANVQMFDTDIKDECAKQMAFALKANHSLKQVNVGWNTFSPKYVTQINKLTKENISKQR